MVKKKEEENHNLIKFWDYKKEKDVHFLHQWMKLINRLKYIFEISVLEGTRYVMCMVVYRVGVEML